jgi:hypothetical protein
VEVVMQSANERVNVCAHMISGRMFAQGQQLTMQVSGDVASSVSVISSVVERALMARLVVSAQSAVKRGGERGFVMRHSDIPICLYEVICHTSEDCAKNIFACRIFCVDAAIKCSTLNASEANNNGDGR